MTDTPMDVMETENNSCGFEEPCCCDCGNWFDLQNGYGCENCNKVVCSEKCLIKANKLDRPILICDDCMCDYL